MADLTEKALKEISDILSDFRAQHNHKETMAWAGIVFFSVICLQLAKTNESPIMSTIFLIVFVILVYLFVSKQYEQQEHAVNINAACISLTAKIISGKKTIKESKCTVCAKGAIFLSAIQFSNKMNLDDVVDISKNELQSIRGSLRK